MKEFKEGKQGRNTRKHIQGSNTRKTYKEGRKEGTNGRKEVKEGRTEGIKGRNQRKEGNKGSKGRTEGRKDGVKVPSRMEDKWWCVRIVTPEKKASIRERRKEGRNK